MNDNLRGAALMSLAMAAFTANDACMRAIAGHLPVAQVLFLRGGITAAILFAIAAHRGLLVQAVRLDRRGRLMVGLRCLGEVWTAFAVLISLQHMALSTFTAIGQAGPLAIGLAGAVFLREPLGWHRLLVILAGFVGVMIIIRPGTDVFDVWSLAALAAVAGLTLRDLSARRLPAGLSPVVAALAGAIAVAAAAGVWSLSAPWQVPSLRTMVLLVCGAVCLVAAYILVVRTMQVGEIGFVAPFRYTGLLWALMLGTILLGERPDGATLLGAGIVVAAGAYTLFAERRQRGQIPPGATR
ncbi:MAG: DMT family transporter [Rhodobacteraceae bacterium]|nr:DMT family transporter [Paracoccaceae bacterium]